MTFVDVNKEIEADVNQILKASDLAKSLRGDGRLVSGKQNETPSGGTH